MDRYSADTYTSALSTDITLVSRSSLSVTGVNDIESSDGTLIVTHTEGGLLIIRGSELRIEKLSIDGGDLRVNGRVDSLTFEEEKHQNIGFFSRLLR
ncbi:MAG: sporulation protein [Oscillospiraceae bacterium]|jgi:sporulation protein YabP|nr:sporulation protein [Oscillospiraceae bacterium]